jgi:hypothetical protein
MTRGRVGSLWAAVCVVGGLLVAACSGPLPAPMPFLAPPNPNAIAAEAGRAAAKATMLHVKGGVDLGGAMGVDVMLEPGERGAAGGNGTMYGTLFNLAADGDRTFVRSDHLWSTVVSNAGDARALAGKWVLVRASDTTYRGDRLAPLVPAVRHLAALRTPDGRSLAGHFTLGRKVTVGGKNAIEVKARGISFAVTATGPRRLLRVTAASVKDGEREWRHVSLDVRASGRQAVAVPAAGQYLDLNDESTWPAKYDTASVEPDEESCDQFSCQLHVDVTNQAGPPEGQSVVTIEVWTPAPFGSAPLMGPPPDGPPFKTCQAPIPPLAHGQTATVTCSIGGDDWTAAVEAASGPGDLFQYPVDSTLHNPPYDA